MKHLTFHFDVVSPFAYLAFERLPQALEGLSVDVSYRPLLFAGLLAHWGQKGPAEIEPKRSWTYRHVAWLAHHHGIALQLPAQHPFNPLALLRLAVACAPPLATPSRHVCEQVFRHVWQGGGDANDPARLQALQAALAPALDPSGEAVKQSLKEATTQAVATGIFGVPTIEVDHRLFWGFDALDMAAAYLRDDPWFGGPEEAAAVAVRAGVQRRP
jgi:2-hydroxychromene-2-carboxylate isomerase